LVIASIIAIAGLALTYLGKTTEVAAQKPFLLSDAARAEQIVPLLQMWIPLANARPSRARSTIWSKRTTAICRTLVLSGDSVMQAVSRSSGQSQLARLKADLAVRTLPEYRRAFLLWGRSFLPGFYIVHVLWRMRGFKGEQAILPILHLLTAVGLCLMVSLRDPLRDTLAFADFARAIALSLVVLAAVSFIDVPRVFSRLSFVPAVGRARPLPRVDRLRYGPGRQRRQG
jgi:hypothetical protein